MKEFNTYERMVIKNHVNPKVCLMSSGANWMYLNDLQYKHNAGITILGADPKFLSEYNKMADYDIMILDSPKEFNKSDLHVFLEASNILSSEYEKKIVLIYYFVNGERSKVCQFVSDNGSTNDLGFVDGKFDSRDLLDIAMKNYLNLEKEKKREPINNF